MSMPLKKVGFNMYKSFLTSELKKWFRDPLMKFMIFYPIIFGLIGRFVLPAVAKASNFKVEHIADYVVVILTLFIPIIYGALVGFSILDDRDDSILTSIRTTPLSIHQFLSFRLIIATFMSFVGCIFVIKFSNIVDITITKTLAISFLAALSTPTSGLLINALANNKIEGFAVMKGTGMIIIFPIVALSFTDTKELFFSFAPGFWPAKVISITIRNTDLLLTYNQYFYLGLIYIIMLNILTYMLFLKKIKI